MIGGEGMEDDNWCDLVMMLEILTNICSLVQEINISHNVKCLILVIIRDCKMSYVTQNIGIAKQINFDNDFLLSLY